MFSIYHIVWIVITVLAIVLGFGYIKKHNPPFEKILNVMCGLCIASELTKMFSVMQIVPTADGSMYYPYIELGHLPFHMCSIQILLIFFIRFGKDSNFKQMILGFMYPSCLLGAFAAVLLPSIFGTTIQANQAFTHPIGYQYFLYHAMLVVLGLYIPICGKVKLQPKHYLSTLYLVFGAALISLYVNSMFASPVYQNGVLQSVDYTTNFFFTYTPPIPIALTEYWHWILYLLVMISLVVGLVALVYLPVFKAAKREKQNQKEKQNA